MESLSMIAGFVDISKRQSKVMKLIIVFTRVIITNCQTTSSLIKKSSKTQLSKERRISTAGNVVIMRQLLSLIPLRTE